VTHSRAPLGVRHASSRRRHRHRHRFKLRLALPTTGGDREGNDDHEGPFHSWIIRLRALDFDHRSPSGISTMTSQGSAHGSFQRAIERANAELAAREMGHVNLPTRWRWPLLIAEADPDWWPRAAARWHAPFVQEAPASHSTRRSWRSQPYERCRGRTATLAPGPWVPRGELWPRDGLRILSVRRTVLINRGRGKATIHEHSCSFITRRINNGLRLEDKYEEIAVDQVPANAVTCHWCAAPVDPRRQAQHSVP
jgi:hypothetical protein